MMTQGIRNKLYSFFYPNLVISLSLPFFMLCTGGITQAAPLSSFHKSSMVPPQHTHQIWQKKQMFLRQKVKRTAEKRTQSKPFPFKEKEIFQILPLLSHQSLRRKNNGGHKEEAEKCTRAEGFYICPVAHLPSFLKDQALSQHILFSGDIFSIAPIKNVTTKRLLRREIKERRERDKDLSQYYHVI